jgi:hypothetical protein
MKKSAHIVEAFNELRDATERACNQMALARDAWTKDDAPALAKALHECDKALGASMRRTGTLRHDLGISIKTW